MSRVKRFLPGPARVKFSFMLGLDDSGQPEWCWVGGKGAEDCENEDKTRKYMQERSCEHKILHSVYKHSVPFIKRRFCIEAPFLRG